MKLNRSIYIFLYLSKIMVANSEFVNYGWEAFDYITDARSSALGNSNIAYKAFDLPGSSIINPKLITANQKYIS